MRVGLCQRVFLQIYADYKCTSEHIKKLKEKVMTQNETEAVEALNQMTRHSSLCGWCVFAV